MAAKLEQEFAVLSRREVDGVGYFSQFRMGLGIDLKYNGHVAGIEPLAPDRFDRLPSGLFSPAINYENLVGVNGDGAAKTTWRFGD